MRLGLNRDGGEVLRVKLYRARCAATARLVDQRNGHANAR